MGSDDKHTGGCACGTVRYRVGGEPVMIAYCHCEDCRRSSGSAVAVLAGFRRADFEMLQGSPEYYSSTPEVKRGFCPRCGSPLSYENRDFEENVYLHIGSFDSPESLPPDRHTFTSERISWHRIDDDLTQYQQLSNAGQANNTPPYRKPE